MSFIPKTALALSVSRLINTPAFNKTHCQDKDLAVQEKKGASGLRFPQPLHPSNIKKVTLPIATTYATGDNQTSWFKWCAKVAALSLEAPAAIGLINYRFFQQTQSGNASSYTPKFSEYFTGLHIIGPLRVASYSLALGASELGQSLAKSLWPSRGQETQYLFGGGCSALVGGLLSVPVEGVMVKGMDAIRKNQPFHIMSALRSKPSTSAILITWGREMPYFLGLAVGAKLIQPLLPNYIPESQKENTSLVITATAVSYATQPADTIKSKVQQNQWTIQKAISEMSKNGFQAFFVGSVPRLLKVYLNFFVTWVVADKIYKVATAHKKPIG